jgi:hypothetical protein
LWNRHPACFIPKKQAILISICGTGILPVLSSKKQAILISICGTGILPALSSKKQAILISICGTGILPVLSQKNRQDACSTGTEIFRKSVYNLFLGALCPFRAVCDKGVLAV